MSPVLVGSSTIQMRTFKPVISHFTRRTHLIGMIEKQSYTNAYFLTSTLTLYAKFWLGRDERKATLYETYLIPSIST